MLHILLFICELINTQTTSIPYYSEYSAAIIGCIGTHRRELRSGLAELQYFYF